MTTRFKNGVTNVAQESTLGHFLAPDPTKMCMFFDDFLGYTTAEWVITTTEAGAGSAAEILISGDGGLLQITNAAGDNDNDFFQWEGSTAGTTVIEPFLFETGKKMWFKARFKVSDATQSDVVMGLQIADTSPLATTDGVFFLKSDAAATVDFLVEKDSTATTESSVATMADDTFITLGYYYNGSTFSVYANDVEKASGIVGTNLPDDEELTVSFGVQNGEAVAKVLTIDYILAAKER